MINEKRNKGIQKLVEYSAYIAIVNSVEKEMLLMYNMYVIGKKEGKWSEYK